MRPRPKASPWTPRSRTREHLRSEQTAARESAGEEALGEGGDEDDFDEQVNNNLDGYEDDQRVAKGPLDELSYCTMLALFPGSQFTAERTN